MSLDEVVKAYREKFITWKDAQEMRENGFKTGALHIHSAYSYDCPKQRSTLPHRIVMNAKKKGFDHVAITDHDNEDAWYNYSKHSWIRGIEVMLSDKTIGHPFEFNFLNIPDSSLTREIFCEAKKDAHRAVELALDNGCTVIANHPFFTEEGTYDTKGYWDLVRAFNLPVELNQKRNFVENYKTFYNACRYNLPLVSASDDHTCKLAKIATVAKGETEEEFLENVRNGNSYLVTSSSGLIEYTNTFIDYIQAITRCSGKKIRGLKQDTSKIHWMVHTAESIANNHYTKNWLAKKGAEKVVLGISGVFGACYYPYSLAKSLYRAIKS